MTHHTPLKRLELACKRNPGKHIVLIEWDYIDQEPDPVEIIFYETYVRQDYPERCCKAIGYYHPGDEQEPASYDVERY